MFQGPSRPQFDQGFNRVNILPREACGEVVANKRSYEALKSLGGATHQAGRATSARLALERHLVSVFFMYAFVTTEKRCPTFPIIF
jgi:hypothetical protein